MSEINLDEMSNEYFDVLKELGNIGAGNATTALAQLMQTKVDMSVPRVQLLEFKDLGRPWAVRNWSWREFIWP